MTNKRKLKKEINTSIYKTINDCNKNALTQPKNRESAKAIIDDAEQLRKNLLGQINSSKNHKTRKAVKNHFTQINSEFTAQHKSLSDRLQKMG